MLDDAPGGSAGDQPPTAIAATEQAIPLRVTLVDDERTPEGMLCMGTFRDERLIGRSVVSPDTWAEVEGRGFFGEPRPVVLVAREAPPGLQCQLFAMLPADLIRPDDADAEPWAASVPSSSYEQAVAGEGDDDGPPVVAFPLGQIVRFAKDRVHPDNLALEAVDVLRKVIEGRTAEPIDKALDDLLGGG